MVVSFIGTASVSGGTSASSVTLGRHANTVVGDLMIVTISGSSLSPWSLTVPTGWTAIIGGATTSTGQRSYYYYKYLAADDPTIWAWGWSPTGQTMYLTSISYRGVLALGTVGIKGSGFDGTASTSTEWSSSVHPTAKETGILFSHFVSHGSNNSKTRHSSDTISTVRLSYSTHGLLDRPLTKGNTNDYNASAAACTAAVPWTSMSVGLYDTVPNSLPTAPTGLAVTNQAKSGDPFFISWTHNDGDLNPQVKYQIRYRKV